METMRDQILRWRLPHGTDRMTMTLDADGGKGRIERPGTVRRMFIAWQRSNRVVVRVCVFQKRVPQSRIKGLWLTSWRPPGLALPVRSSLIANG